MLSILMRYSFLNKKRNLLGSFYHYFSANIRINTQFLSIRIILGITNAFRMAISSLHKLYMNVLTIEYDTIR